MVFCLSMAFLPENLAAQVVTGAIIGQVRDTSGAMIPGATITVSNQETGFAETGISDSRGLYNFRALPVGDYWIQVNAQGFGSLRQGPLALSSTQQAEVNLTLSPGSVQQTVEVNSAAEFLQTQEGAVKSQVTQTQVENLPLNGRNPTALVLLGPSTSIALQASGGSSLGFTINGQNQNGSSLRLDGIDTSIGTDPGMYFGSLNFNLNGTSIDAIQEFDIQTSNYSADSKGSSGYVNVVTKSGTNQWHLDVYDYFRNGAMDALNYFSTSKGSSRGLKQNDFGGTLLGPIFKNKMFYMVSYEGQRILLPYPGYANVLTAAFRATVDPRLQPFLDATPLPTSAVAGNTDIGIYQNTVQQNTRQDLGTARIDYIFSPKDRVFTRYVINDGVVSGAAPGQGASNNGNTIFPGYNFEEPIRHQTAIVDWTHVFSTSLLNDAKVGLNRYWEHRLRGDSDIFNLPVISVPGVSLNGGGNQKNWGVTEGELDDKATWVRGKSTLSFGMSYQYWVSGLNQFSVATISYPTLAAFAADQASALSNGLGLAGSEPGEHIRDGQWAAYVQEDFRWTPNLTINLGLRYDTFGVMADSEHHAINVQDGPFSPFRGPNQPLYDRNNDFSPRVGFAWKVLPDFVLRGGFGLFYGARASGQAGDILVYNQVGSYSITNADLPGLTYPFPPEVYQFAAQSPGRGVMNPFAKDLYTEQWNLTVQQQLGQSTTLEIGYVGNHQVHMQGAYQPNVYSPLLGSRPNPNFGSVKWIDDADTGWYNSLQLTFRHRLSHNIAWDTFYSWSHATGLETNSQEVTAAVGYAGGEIQTFANKNFNRYAMPFDTRHQFTNDLTYFLPRFAGSNAFMQNALGGWSTSGILKASTGLPFNLTTGGDSGDGTFTQWPDLIPGVSAYLDHSPARGFLNPAAFAVPSEVDRNTGLVLGHILSNSIHMPAVLTLDWDLAKRLYTRDRFGVDFRGEFFNILNHPVFALPITNLSAANFGQSQSASDPREIQLMLKLSF